MKEIKFRAFDNITNKIYKIDHLLWDSPKNGISVYAFVMMYKNELNNFEGEVIQYIGDTLSNITLIQYTGLKDSTNKEIYDGDIVALYWKRRILVKRREKINEKDIYKEDLVKEIEQVKWDSYSDGEYNYKIECWMTGYNSLSELLTYDGTYGHSKYEKCEVIGNIHDNSELVKEEI